MTRLHTDQAAEFLDMAINAVNQRQDPAAISALIAVSRALLRAVENLQVCVNEMEARHGIHRPEIKPSHFKTGPSV